MEGTHCSTVKKRKKSKYVRKSRKKERKWEMGKENVHAVSNFLNSSTPRSFQEVHTPTYMNLNSLSSSGFFGTHVSAARTYLHMS